MFNSLNILRLERYFKVLLSEISLTPIDTFQANLTDTCILKNVALLTIKLYYVHVPCL